MSTSDWHEDDEPLAPLPAHERAWRHPSEVGEHEWLISEPPLALGRGLVLTTTVVVSLLAFAVLWTTIPTRAGRGVASSGAEGVVNLDASSVTDLATSTAPRLSATTAPPSTAAERMPLPTMAVHASFNAQPSSARRVLALPVQQGSLLVTTAPAVAEGSDVEIELPDGTMVVASVLLVDGLHGLAVLAPVDALTTESFAVATVVHPGDELTVLGDPALKVTFEGTDASSGELPDTADVPEGAPVLNQRGELVALCTHDADGTPRLLTLSLLDALSAMIGDAGQSPVWIGIVINDDPSSALTVGAIDPDGPAARAGLRTGDVVTAVDGTAVTTCDGLVAMLAAHQPGDVVVVTVRGVDGTTRALEVELAKPKTAI